MAKRKLSGAEEAETGSVNVDRLFVSRKDRQHNVLGYDEKLLLAELISKCEPYKYECVTRGQHFHLALLEKFKIENEFNSVVDTSQHINQTVQGSNVLNNDQFFKKCNVLSIVVKYLFDDSCNNICWDDEAAAIIGKNSNKNSCTNEHTIVDMFISNLTVLILFYHKNPQCGGDQMLDVLYCKCIDSVLSIQSIRFYLAILALKKIVLPIVDGNNNNINDKEKFGVSISNSLKKIGFIRDKCDFTKIKEYYMKDSLTRYIEINPDCLKLNTFDRPQVKQDRNGKPIFNVNKVGSMPIAPFLQKTKEDSKDSDDSDNGGGYDVFKAKAKQKKQEKKEKLHLQWKQGQGKFTNKMKSKFKKLINFKKAILEEIEKDNEAMDEPPTKRLRPSSGL